MLVTHSSRPEGQVCELTHCPCGIHPLVFGLTRVESLQDDTHILQRPQVRWQEEYPELPTSTNLLVLILIWASEVKKLVIILILTSKRLCTLLVNFGPSRNTNFEPKILNFGAINTILKSSYWQHWVPHSKFGSMWFGSLWDPITITVLLLTASACTPVLYQSGVEAMLFAGIRLTLWGLPSNHSL